MKLTHETTAAGKERVVAVEAKSGLPADDYLKNAVLRIRRHAPRLSVRRKTPSGWKGLTLICTALAATC